MSLDPQAKTALEMLAMVPPIDFSKSGSEVRAERAAVQAGESPFAPGDDVERIEDRSIVGPGGAMGLRIYWPLNRVTPTPALVYFHGGGFVFGTPPEHDNVCRCIANRARVVVVSVDYRLAPEAKFPAAVDDGWSALQWVRTSANELGIDASRVAVGGDSAGGNLAAVVAQKARDNEVPIKHQLLLYPVTDSRFETTSYRENGQGYFLTTEMMRWFWRQYLPDMDAGSNPLASPLRHSDLAGLASATIVTAEYDPLRDEGEAYAHALDAAGVRVTLQRYPGQIHGFASMLGIIDAADAALHLSAERLRAAFE
ncbi:alpha/beta hydrolase [Paraburkholderia sacchari]|uniref:alpha/beta hydrolase n=1 Tax=Paraburkholderia sacchari TaxID=159450 RepID=UPI0005434291|nr:alpha/beta hydrolase [Paraburkholderia sacchari]NLP64879.1 alpha/beta hydrolase [Paraburkholderia sacchari]